MLSIKNLQVKSSFDKHLLIHQSIDDSCRNLWDFPGGKESACQTGDVGSVPGLGRSPGEGNGNPLQYSCLENPMDRGAGQAKVQGVLKSWTRLRAKQ